jgi:hypothetical protein
MRLISAAGVVLTVGRLTPSLGLYEAVGPSGSPVARRTRSLGFYEPRGRNPATSVDDVESRSALATPNRNG